MKLLQRAAWRATCMALSAYQRLFLDLRVWGRENIPKGPKIFVSSHLTAWDPFWLLPIYREPVHIVIGPAFDNPYIARLLRWLEQISCLPDSRGQVVPQAVEYLRRGESVYLAPEGNLRPLFDLGRFYPGFARMYMQSRAPIVPVALLAPTRNMSENPRQTTRVADEEFRMVRVLRGVFCVSIGEPLTPELPPVSEAGQEQFLVDLVRERIRGLTEDVRVNRFWLG